MKEAIILCNTKEDAYKLSRNLWVEECKKTGIDYKNEVVETILFAVDENILSGQYGLHLSYKYWDKIYPKYKSNLLIKTPLWINEKFINGEPFNGIGSFGPFGFGVGFMDPKENRKILEGNFSPKIISEARNKARFYSVEVQDRAINIINDYIEKPLLRKKILETIDPYQFEELIAEILLDNGFDIFLTPKSGDGGKDIIAAYTYNDEPILMMVECKRRKVNETLGPIEMRALIGQYFFENYNSSSINYALLVTSARNIGGTALNMEEKIKEISIKNFEDINKWILNYGKSKSGLWLPNSFSDFFY